MKEDRSRPRIIQSRLDLKTWLERTPTVDEVRPGQCAVCQRPSRPPGKPLGLWGHGLRLRQQRGPLSPDGKPETVEVAARRYQCRGCGAVLLVVPRGMMPRRHYAASAIALALALLGLLGLSPEEVRRRISPWQIVAEAGRWPTLRRWVEAARRGELFDRVRPSPPHFTEREVAERAAATLGALAPPGPGPPDPMAQAFLGGMCMA